MTRVLERVETSETGGRAFRWTAAQYERLAEMGFFDDKRVELIDGEILEMAAMNSPHRIAILKTDAALRRIFPSKLLAAQLPLRIEDSEPEPDFAVLEGTIEDYRDDHPGSALLVVEISDATLQFDRTRKAALYARAEIPEYWIVNLKTREVEVLRAPKNGKYGTKIVVKENESVTPVTATDASVEVKDLLP